MSPAPITIPVAKIKIWFYIVTPLLAAIAAATPKGKGGFRRHWFVLAAIFVYISIDETAQLHEMLNYPLRHAFGRSGVLHAALYVGGALGTEFYLNYWVSVYGTDTIYGMLNVVQEAMELSGVSLFIVALLEYLRGTVGELNINIA